MKSPVYKKPKSAGQVPARRQSTKWPGQHIQLAIVTLNCNSEWSLGSVCNATNTRTTT